VTLSMLIFSPIPLHLFASVDKLTAALI
jgi:hypothetical protein